MDFPYILIPWEDITYPQQTLSPAETSEKFRLHELQGISCIFEEESISILPHNPQQRQTFQMKPDDYAQYNSPASPCTIPQRFLIQKVPVQLSKSLCNC